MEPEHTPNPQLSRGIYGFVMYLFFVSFITIYLLWLIIPSSVTSAWTYEPPQKYWALAVPIFLCTVLFLFAFCIYPAMCSRHDGELHEMSCIRDNFTVANAQSNFGLDIPMYDFSSELNTKCPNPEKVTKRSSRLEKGPKWKLYDESACRTILINRAIPPASDLDPVQVSKLLYMNRKAR